MTLLFSLKLETIVLCKNDIYLPIVVVVFPLSAVVNQSETTTANAKPPVSTPTSKPPRR